MRAPTSSCDLAPRRGFTLLEMIIVIALMALAAAIALPNIARLISRTTSQTVFFDFQRQATELRARAYRERQALVLVSSGEFVDDVEADPSPAEIQFLDQAWSYRLSEPMVISAGGVCSPVTVSIFQDRVLALTLQGRPDCKFLQAAS